jgi:hypothetical protein
MATTSPATCSGSAIPDRHLRSPRQRVIIAPHRLRPRPVTAGHDRRAHTGACVPTQRPVRGAATGRLYGAPATKRSFEASFFDYVRVDDGQIIERVQQADMLAQMRQLYGKGLGLIGLDAMFLRL